jgi:hypothetical protein
MSKDWDHTTDKINRGVAFQRQAGADDAVLQAGIDAAMREVVARPYNPNALRPPDKVGIANAPVVVTAGEGRGLVEPKELELVVRPGSMADRAISNLIDEALPPGAEKNARRK